MSLPPDVASLLDGLLKGIRDRLGDNLVGVYLRGSLATGGFIPETSDIDLLAVTERPVNSNEFAALEDLHGQLAEVSNPYARRLEIAYIDRGALRRFAPGLRHPTLGQGEALEWSEHGSNWILERWMVLECGVGLEGPDPKTLISPIAPEEMVAAVRSRLGDWAEWASEPEDPDRLPPRSHEAYVIETMCRALSTLACHRLLSKPDAVAWGLETLPELWRPLVHGSREWRTDPTCDPDLVREVRRFVQWAAQDGAVLFGGASAGR